MNLRRRILAAYFACLVASLAAAGGTCDPTNGMFPVGVAGPAGDSFANARLLNYDTSNTVTLSGNVSGDEVDFYEIGTLEPGDRIIVAVNAVSGGSLDPVIAIFNDAEELFALNDDVDLAGGNLNSAMDDIVTEPASRLYLLITKFAFGSQGGEYEGTVQIEQTGAVPTLDLQTLLLDFNGGAFSITNEGSFDLDPFDAADIDAAYAGMTGQIKDKIAETVRENFAETGLVIVTTDENPVLTPGTFSVIYFGAFSPDKFGVADSVDQGNADRCDDGIVFTNSFDDPFSTQPSANGIGVAIGNVAAHEAGHLLGLNHVADVDDLMDNTGTASTLLADQEFMTSELSPSVFPLGFQNSPALLERVVPAP